MPIASNSTSYRESEPDRIFEPATVQLPDDKENATIDQKTGARITVEDDGSVTIDLNPTEKIKKKSKRFDANLAEEMSTTELSDVASELIRSIENDIQSRVDYDAFYDRGITLMGLKLESASSEVSATGSISKVFHPLLIEATVRYQSTAMAELLPASGPVKVRDDSLKQDQARMDLADAFEKDFNHYLTTVAKEYYPDTDQLLFNQGWSGLCFKKVYFCPIRKRPCSDMVLAPDLIVSNDAVDLETCERITHRTYMSNGMIRRLQKGDVYRTVDLGQPVEQPTAVELKTAEVANIMLTNKLPSDHRHTIYEMEVSYDLPGYEADFPLPYRITIDKDSKEILAIRRNWDEADEDFKAECQYVKFGMIPALGFYSLGLVHLLGNTARALTAILRMQLDAGQFSIFPAFLFSKQGGKQTNNEIRLPPGGGKEIDCGGGDIKQAVMPLPYPGPSAVLSSISDKVAADGMRLGMASEVQVGEGRADVPVGTTMALIDQAMKTMAAVHKRNHVAQQREFEKLRKLFNKNPEALWKFSKNPARKWQTAEEFADLELVPASDPNIPSHTHRLMQANALVMMAKGATPGLFNERNVATRALDTIGIKDIENILNPPPPPNAPPPPPSPENALKMQDIQVKREQMQLSAQQQAAHDQSRLQEVQLDAINKDKDRQSREKIAAMQEQAEVDKHNTAMKVETYKHATGLMSDHLLHRSGIASDQAIHQSGIAADQTMHTGGLIADYIKHATGIVADHHEQVADHGLRRDEMKHEADTKPLTKTKE